MKLSKPKLAKPKVSMKALDHADAPFSEAQVEAIDGYQRLASTGLFHPLTCIEHSDDLLVVSELGLSCTKCSYLQRWVPKFIANGGWRKYMPQAQ